MYLHFIFCDSLAWYKKLGTWLIKKVDGSSSGHFAVGASEREVGFVYEAVLPKSRVLFQEDWIRHYKENYRVAFKIPKDLELEVVRYLDSLVNKPYSIFQLALIFVSKILMPTNLVLKGAILNHEKAIICTELGSRFIEKFMALEIHKSHDNIGIKDLEIITSNLVQLKNPWKAAK